MLPAPFSEILIEVVVFFPDPTQGVREFNRLLRPGGRLVLSVNTSAARSYNSRITLAISRYVPQLAEDANRVFAIGDEAVLTAMLEQAGFAEIRDIHRDPPLHLPVVRYILRGG